MIHIATLANWRRLLFIYVPVAYFTLSGLLFRGYQFTAWMLKLMGVD
jgi:hypothetical protein